MLLASSVSLADGYTQALERSHCFYSSPHKDSAAVFKAAQGRGCHVFRHTSYKDSGLRETSNIPSFSRKLVVVKYAQAVKAQAIS